MQDPDKDYFDYNYDYTYDGYNDVVSKEACLEWCKSKARTMGAVSGCIYDDEYALCTFIQDGKIKGGDGDIDKYCWKLDPSELLLY